MRYVIVGPTDENVLRGVSYVVLSLRH